MRVTKCMYCGVDIVGDYENCPFCGERVVSREPAPGAGVNNNDAGGASAAEPQGDGTNGYNNDPNQVSLDDLSGMGTGHDERKEDGNVAGSCESSVKDEGQPVYHIRNTIEPVFNDKSSQPLSNGLKVFLTAITVLMPGVGPIIGIICAVVFMNSEGDADKRSFGQALLITALAIFALACISCFGITMVLTALRESPGRWTN